MSTKVFEYSLIIPNLYLSSRPKNKEDIQEIENLGVSLVINMMFYGSYKKEKYGNYKYINYKTIDSLATPIPLKFLIEGSKEADIVLKNGGKVLVHCKYGVHRSVAMVVAILMYQGLSKNHATKLVKQKRKVADPDSYWIKYRLDQLQKVLLTQ